MKQINIKKVLAIIILFSGIGLWIGIIVSSYVMGASTKTQLSKVAAKTSVGTKASGSNNSISNSSGLPKTLIIPKIGVKAPIEYVGLDGAGRMDVPKQWYTVAWYKLGYKVGDKGSAALSGHLDTSSGSPAVFYNIGKLNTGDEISVIDDKGDTFKFRVYEKQYYPYDGFPLQRVFGSSGRVELSLITCGGTWDRNAKNYSQRIVIYSELIK